MQPLNPLHFPSRVTFILVMALALAWAPITAHQSLADDGPPAFTAPTVTDAGNAALQKARALIKANNWRGALSKLEAAREARPKNADVYNLMGYANRKLRRFEVSLSNYRRALRLDPNHKGALEYLGELYVETGLLTSHLDRGHLSIVDLFQLALEVGGPDNHLCAVQLPYNLALCEAQGLKTQIGPDGYGAALETLMDTGTTVFATVPLAQGRAVRGLPEFVREAFPGLRTDAQRCLQFARSAPGVTTALVGMRLTEHVEENLATAEIEPAAPEVIEALFERARDEA